MWRYNDGRIRLLLINKIKDNSKNSRMYLGKIKKNLTWKLCYSVLILFSSCMNKNFGNYDVNKISRYIEANTVYPETAVSKNLSALVLLKITFKKNGSIDSVFTLQSQESVFSQVLIATVKKADPNLFKGINKIPIIIPIYFLHSDQNEIVKINYEKDFRPENFDKYPFKCTFFKAIIIVSRSNNRMR